MPLTCFRRHDFSGASQRLHLGKLARSYKIFRLHSLMILITVVDFWAGLYILSSLALTLCTWLVFFVSFCKKPPRVHSEGALRVLAYIKQAPGRGLIYRRHGCLHIEAYSYAGYASDKGDRKSNIGFFTYIGGNLIIW